VLIRKVDWKEETCNITKLSYTLTHTYKDVKHTHKRYTQTPILTHKYTHVQHTQTIHTVARAQTSALCVLCTQNKAPKHQVNITCDFSTNLQPIMSHIMRDTFKVCLYDRPREHFKCHKCVTLCHTVSQKNKNQRKPVLAALAACCARRSLRSLRRSVQSEVGHSRDTV
jgi:hypothetical protein